MFFKNPKLRLTHNKMAADYVPAFTIRAVRFVSVENKA
jgi:hypothetical protein